MKAIPKGGKELAQDKYSVEVPNEGKDEGETKESGLLYPR